ncbi:DMT family transporter [Kordiimonas aquimaris]|uniref:DMT family transporter n=1 Tax=Kordiimonas aquimaris TaxID=707591 RepID=UPI0021D09CB2|nr:DMT family transporter [Kordiimonas aquimaris]
MSNHSSYSGIIAILVGGMAIGFAAIFMRLAPVAPTSAGFWRVMISIPAFMVIALVARGRQKTQPKPITMKVWIQITMVGVWFAADLFFWHWSVAETSVANATLLANLASVLTAVAGFLFFGERFSRRFLMGLTLALVGAGFLVGQNATYRPDYLVGDILGIVTALALTGYLITAAKIRSQVPTHILMLGSAVVTALLLLPAALLSEGPFIPESLAGWGPLVGLALISHVMGQSLIIYGLAHVPAAYGAVGLLIQPVFAAILAWTIFGETLGLLHVIGGALILTGITVTQTKGRKRQLAK